MSVIARELLDRLEHHYRQLLSMPDPLAAFTDGLLIVDGDYASTGFVKVRGVLPAEAFASLACDLLPILHAVAEPVRLRHEPTPQGMLSDGATFARVDPDCSPNGATLARLLDLLGLRAFGKLLAERLTPLVQHVAGDVYYQRLYCYVYGEGDYISVHNDHHVGDRVDIQFAHSPGSSAGLRVLTDGLLRMHYDRPGSMNVLGPRIWHDVPPLTRTETGAEPQRVTIGLRFMPPTDA